MKLFRSSLAALVATPFLVATANAQANFTCSTFQNELLNTANPAFSPTETVAVQAGDTITIDSILVNPSFPDIDIGTAVSISPTSGAEQNCGFGGAADCAGTSFTSPVDDIITIEVIWTQFPGSDGAGAFFSCTEATVGGGGGGGGAGTAGDDRVASTTAQAAGIAGGAQSRATGAAISNAMSAARSTGSADQFATRGFFNGIQIIQDGDAGLRLWGGLASRRYAGDFSGAGADMIVGADTAAGSLVYGFALSFSALEIDASDLEYEISSTAIGPYATYALDDVFSIEGYLMFARPSYQVSDATFQASRMFGSVSATARTSHSWGYMVSSLGLSGFREDLPRHEVDGTSVEARSIVELTGFANTRLQFDLHSDFTPFLSIGLDANFHSNGVDADAQTLSPRVGAGFTWSTEMGTVSLSVDGGEIADGTHDFGGVVSFTTNF